MAYVANGKVFVDGDYVGEAASNIKDGTIIDVSYETQPVYVIE